MKIKSFFLLAIISSLFLTTVNSNAQNNSYSLKIQIVGLKSNDGKILLQLFNNKDEPVAGKTTTIENHSCSISFSQLMQGKYSIRYFHDENENDKLDTNWFGIPSEGYGFSNNASSIFGPPATTDKLFFINKNTEVFLKISY